MFIDDRNLGGLPDWGTIYQMITNHETWETLNYRHLSLEEHKAPKRNTGGVFNGLNIKESAQTLSFLFTNNQLMVART